MLAFSYAANARALLRGAHHLIVVAPRATLAKAKFPSKVLGKRLADLTLALAAETAPGRTGALGSTLVSANKLKDAPLWLSVGVLPDQLSRYNSPSRANAIKNVVASARLGKSGKVAVLLILDDEAHLLAAANAVGRAIHQFSTKARQTKAKVQIGAISISGSDLPIGATVRATVNHARDSAELVDTPPADLNPDSFAARARAYLKDTKGVKVSEIKGDKLLEQGLGGIHAVGRAAVTPPRLFIAEWNSGADGPHVALVGKGITYDTGGLHLKGRGSMEGMKSDMGGAAAMLGAFRVLTDEGHAGRVTLLLCIAENAIDQHAYKPDDILTLHSGKTVEINNTDAEGRLVLADGLSYAARELGADVLIDAATLTGAQLISTGKVHAAIVSNDEALEHAVVAAGRHSGDLVHPLPFAPELYQQEFASPVADMRNSVANRMNAQCACAAQFLYAHIENAPKAAKRRWCHIDLAGPAFPKNRGSGFGVALVAEVVRRLGA